MARGDLNPLMVTDDRGNAYRVPWARRERRKGCFGAKLQKEIEREEWAHRCFFGLKNSTAMAIGAAMMMMPFLLKLIPAGWVSEDLVGVAVLLLISFGLLIVLGVGAVGRPRSIVVDALRIRSLCPVCVYDLAGSPIAGDGCTVCPECGAAWRLCGRGPEGN